MTPKLVIFDCDGVLVDTEGITNEVLAENVTRHGLPLTPDQAIDLFGGGTIKSAGEEAIRRGAILPPTWVEDTYEEIFAALRQGVDVIPGVLALLHRLESEGIAIAVASNGPLAKMEITLKPSGLWSIFDGRIYSGHQHGPKPAPDMVVRIMADAGVTGGETVMIDDMAAGCLAARAAGVRCLGYVADGDPSRLDGTAAELIFDLEEVPSLIGL